MWEALENLLESCGVTVKKEIFKILELNSDILKYLLEMYDDTSADTRLFVFEKLSELNDFSLISSKHKMRLFYFGLSDQSPKVKVAAKNLLNGSDGQVEAKFSFLCV